MTPRIAELREYILAKRHHEYRTAQPIDPARYRDPALSDDRRSAIRLAAHLNSEQPVLLPGERIAFTRTMPAAEDIFSPEEWAGIRAAHYIHERGNVCNLSPGYDKIIREGLLAQLQAIDLAGGGEYRDSMRMGIRAVLDLTARYAAYARQQGREDLARVLDRVPAHGATSFWEALQSLRILHFAMWCEGDYHNTLGRFDQYMLPYFTRDMVSGALNQDQALELIEEFFLSLNRDSDLYPGMQQGDNGQSMVLGGMTLGGADGFTPLSELCLTASAELRLIDPKINLRVSGQTPLSVFEMGTRLTRLGLGFPQYENDDVVIPALIKLGYAPEDARNYVVAACWEFILPGVAMEIPNIAALPLAGTVNEVIRERLPGATGMDEILSAVKQKLRARALEIARSVQNLYVIPSPYLSLFFEGCVESGRDISLGAKYNNYGVHGTGLATAADSLAAAEQMVFKRGLSADELIAAMDANFAGFDQLRHRLTFDCPKMGNDDDAADQYGCLLLDAFADALAGLENERGGIFRAGTGSAMYYIWHAADIGATADGRLAEQPLPANYAPSLNAPLHGPASLIRSFVKPNLGRAINGGPLTIEFHDTVFRNDEAITKVAQLVRSFMRGGGHQMQLNAVNRDRLIDAQAHPENYRHLIVRVWGWSGYFVELDKCYQDHIIARAELTL